MLKKIYEEFDKAGYYLQHFLLDASKMGVPQKRERVFFIAMRKDIAGPYLYQYDMFTMIPKLELYFNEPEIKFEQFEDNLGKEIDKNKITFKRWEKRIESDKTFGDITLRINGKGSDFNTLLIHSNQVFPTVCSKGCEVKYHSPIKISKSEFCKIGSFPLDYNFINNNPSYIIGMSVPPIMTAQIAIEIYKQWNKIF